MCDGELFLAKPNHINRLERVPDASLSEGEFHPHCTDERDDKVFRVSEKSSANALLRSRQKQLQISSNADDLPDQMTLPSSLCSMQTTQFANTK